MVRLRFLSNKHTNCDFCGRGFRGNINEDHLFMCDKCVRYLCEASEEDKLKFLRRFSGDKEKEKVIQRFINEEVMGNGGREAQKLTKYHIRGNVNPRFLKLRAAKVWEKPNHFKLDKAGA